MLLFVFVLVVGHIHKVKYFNVKRFERRFAREPATVLLLLLLLLLNVGVVVGVVVIHKVKYFNLKRCERRFAREPATAPLAVERRRQRRKRLG